MYGTFWALVPPIVAIVLALITKETYSSLFLGIVVGALFVGGFNLVDSLDTMINDGFIAALSDGDNAGIFMFLVLLRRPRYTGSGSPVLFGGCSFRPDGSCRLSRGLLLTSAPLSCFVQLPAL